MCLELQRKTVSHTTTVEGVAAVKMNYPWPSKMQFDREKHEPG